MSAPGASWSELRARLAAAGFHPSRSFYSSRLGYDPIYAHRRWEHRQDREWDSHEAAAYQYRRDHESARPPRTWVAQRNYKAEPSQYVEVEPGHFVLTTDSGY